jgi:Transmembrane domain of unknown function (DUF3566)
MSIPPEQAEDATQVASSDAGAPAPPKRRRVADVAAPAPPSSPPAGKPSSRTAGPVEAPLTDGDSTKPAPRPSRRQRRTSAAPVAAASAASAATEAVLDDDLEEPEPRSRRRPKPVRAAAPRPSGQRSERRFRQTLVKVDLWSVTKLSLCFYLSAMFVTIVAMVALWLIADAAGIIKSVEKFLGDLLSAKDFKFLSGEVLRGTILISLVVVALQVVITVIAASFYNIFAELFGGLEITVKEEDSAPRS